MGMYVVGDKYHVRLPMRAREVEAEVVVEVERRRVEASWWTYLSGLSRCAAEKETVTSFANAGIDDAMMEKM